MVIKPDQYEMDSELKNLIHTVNIPKNIQDLLKWFIDANKSTQRSYSIFRWICSSINISGIFYNFEGVDMSRFRYQ